MRKYLLAYNAVSGPVSENAISAFIKANRFIDQWSFLFPGAYFLKSSKDFNELDQSFTELFEPARYVLANISSSPSETNGCLNKEIWDWLANDGSLLTGQGSIE